MPESPKVSQLKERMQSLKHSAICKQPDQNIRDDNFYIEVLRKMKEATDEHATS